ncbi:unnamed protein product, partial [Ceratitis capitata]
QRHFGMKIMQNATVKWQSELSTPQQIEPLRTSLLQLADSLSIPNRYNSPTTEVHSNLQLSKRLLTQFAKIEY